jgi:O-succinylbenzoic acid--CoA ligase
VLHSLSNHYYSALGSNRNIPVGPGDRWLLSLPLYHVGGLGIVLRTILGGAAMVLPRSGRPLRDVLTVHGVTHLSLVATQLRRLLKDPPSEAARRRLSAVLVGGGPSEVALMTQACDAGFPVHTTYGLTEMASQVTTTRPGDGKSRLSTSGKVLDYRQVRIDGGEILVKGETLFKGYVEGDGTNPSRDAEGWFRTGDLGSMDGNGYLTLSGRKDNMFISGGENIHCEEIEACLLSLPGVFQAVVVPVRDDEFGFRPAAFVRFHGKKGVAKDEMIACLEKHLPRFKIPVAFFEWPEETGEAGFKPNRPYLTELAGRRWEGERDR